MPKVIKPKFVPKPAMASVQGTKSFGGSSTGATEGAPYLQLLAHGPMDKYLIGTAGTVQQYLHQAGAESETFNLHKLRVYNNVY
jgi:hypothetical protein